MALAGLVLAAGGARADGPVRQQAVRALRDLADGSCEVREAAFRELLSLAAGNPREILDVLPTDDPDPETSAWVSRLRDRIERDLGKRKRASAYRAAMEILKGTPPLQPIARKLFETPQPAVFMELAEEGRGASAMGYPNARREATAVLKLFLADPETDVRVMPVAGLVMLNSREVILELMTHPDPAIRRETLRQILLIRASVRVSVREVAASLADEDPGVRAVAATALARLAGQAWPDTPEGVREAQAWWEENGGDPRHGLLPSPGAWNRRGVQAEE